MRPAVLDKRTRKLGPVLGVEVRSLPVGRSGQMDSVVKVQRKPIRRMVAFCG